MAFDTDVLISGAGAAGLTLAIDLARRGVDFMLIEQNKAPFGGSRGKGIQPRTLEVFEDLAILEPISTIGRPYPPVRLYKPDGTVQDAPMGDAPASSPAEPHSIPLMVPQFMTEAVMRDRLAELGHRPRFGTRLAGFEQHDDAIFARIAELDDEREIRCRYLVGTDGGRSLVRHALNIAFPGETLGLRALVADVHLSGLDRTVWHRFETSGRADQILICPLAGTDLFQIQGPVPLEGEVDLSSTGLTALIAKRSGRDDIIVHDVTWSSVYSMNARLADHYRVARVFLAGDAAHIHPPTGGQGLNTSVQDAYNLGWKIAAVLGGAPERLLDSYEEERRPIAAEMLELSTRLLGETREGPIRRDREVRQLDLGYRGSSLSMRMTSGDGQLQPGDRAPDAPCWSRAGEPTRLFNLFEGPHWTLLGFSTTNQPAPRDGLHIFVIDTQGDIIDDEGYIAASYGLQKGQWALVRPDGYLAAIVKSDRLEEALAVLP